MVHQYQLNGYNIVLDTCSGSVHVVDEVAYDVIAMYPDHTADEIVAAMMAKYGDREDVTEADLRQCIDDVASLKESGKLWSPDTYENLAFDFKNRNTVVKALCLHVAHTCNLNCSYCFASQGRYQGERALMSFEVGKRAMDFLIENSGSRRNLEVDFFGGEPLMNFDMVKKLVAYCREQEKIHNKNFRFTMTTNGMATDESVGLSSVQRLPESSMPMMLNSSGIRTPRIAHACRKPNAAQSLARITAVGRSGRARSRSRTPVISGGVCSGSTASFVLARAENSIRYSGRKLPSDFMTSR